MYDPVYPNVHVSLGGTDRVLTNTNADTPPAEPQRSFNPPVPREGESPETTAQNSVVCCIALPAASAKPTGLAMFPGMNQTCQLTHSGVYSKRFASLVPISRSVMGSIAF